VDWFFVGADFGQSRDVSAGIKQQHFRRFCSSKGQTHWRGRGTHSTSVSKLLARKPSALCNGAPRHARTGSWENGSAAIASVGFSHPSFSLLRLLAAIRPASGSAVTITIGERSPAIRCIARYARKARSNGARSIRATGCNCASRILSGRSETGSASGNGTSAGGSAVLPTTTQLEILPTTSQLPRKPLNLKHRLLLANNSPLAKRPPSAP